VQFYNLGLRRAKVPFWKRVLTVLLQKTKLNLPNPADTHTAKLLARQVDKILQGQNAAAILCYGYRNAVIADLLKHPAPKIAMDHGGHPGGPEFGRKQPIELKTFQKMTALQVLLPGFAELAKRRSIKTKIVCIPNIVPQIINEKKVKENKNIIINIGRINKSHKRQHLLVEAFAKIAPQFPDWQLHLYGNTDTLRGRLYKRNIEKFIRKHDLQKQAFFKGVTKNPLQALQNAAICGFPSAYEGFSLSLTEAMSAGLPAVGFQDAPSVNELISDGHNGFLAKDITDYAQKLAALMNNAKLREQMGQNARQQMQKYTEDKVWKKWENLFKEINR
jgi:glycosyltransferase involved in cell wall biosynthesis